MYAFINFLIDIYTKLLHLTKKSKPQLLHSFHNIFIHSVMTHDRKPSCERLVYDITIFFQHLKVQKQVLLSTTFSGFISKFTPLTNSPNHSLLLDEVY